MQLICVAQFQQLAFISVQLFHSFYYDYVRFNLECFALDLSFLQP